MRYFLNFISSDYFVWTSIISVLVLPSFCLSYLFTEPNFGKFTIPYGQYLFFFTSIVAAIHLFWLSELTHLKNLANDKILLSVLAIFFVGISISSPTIWNLRLAAIIFLISASALTAASYIFQMNKKATVLVGFILILPFVTPVLLSIFLELFGPINLIFTFNF